MIGIDTNLLLRYLLQDDLPQAKKVQRLMEGGERLFVNLMVLCETVWIISRSYRLSKAEVIAAIETLLNTQGLVIDAEDEAREALELYRLHATDFIDIFIAVTNRSHGAAHTFTFDKKAARMPNFKLLK